MSIIAYVQKILQGIYLTVKCWFWSICILNFIGYSQIILQDVCFYQYVYKGKVYEFLKQ